MIVICGSPKYSFTLPGAIFPWTILDAGADSVEFLGRVIMMQPATAPAGLYAWAGRVDGLEKLYTTEVAPGGWLAGDEAAAYFAELFDWLAAISLATVANPDTFWNLVAGEPVENADLYATRLDPSLHRAFALWLSRQHNDWDAYLVEQARSRLGELSQEQVERERHAVRKLVRSFARRWAARVRRQARLPIIELLPTSSFPVTVFALDASGRLVAKDVASVTITGGS